MEQRYGPSRRSAATMPVAFEPPASNTGVRSGVRAYRPVPSPAMWYAGVDWVRLTLRPWTDGPVDDMCYWRAIREVAAAMGAPHELAKPWSRMGYYGEQIGKAAWGRSAQGLYLEVSGAWAQAAVELNPPFDNIPRLDVQLTLWYDEYMPDIAANAAQSLHAYAIGRGASGARVRYIDGMGGGDTAYSGSRTSDKLLRVYDKYAETQGDEAYKNAWRFEWQYTNDAARDCWPQASEALSAPQYWAGLVVRSCEDRGLLLPSNLPAKVAKAPQLVPMVSDEERRLAWLRNQVRPSVDKLLAAGVSSRSVLDALGLI